MSSFRCCTLAALLSLLPASASAQLEPAPYVFSDRVGPVLETDERAYFGLFPEVEGFGQAQAVAVEDSIRFEIDAAPADTAVTMPRATAEALGRFIETFEQHTTAFYNPNWQVVSPFVRADVPVPHVAPRWDVDLDVGVRRYRGTVLAATDSLVLIQSAAEPYDWRGRNALALRTQDIERVEFGPRGWERYRSAAPLAAGGAGAALGAVGAYLASNDLNAAPERFWAIPALAVLGHELARWLWPRPTPPGSLEERREALYERARFSAERRPYDLPRITAFESREGYAYEPVPEQATGGLFWRWYRRYGVVSVGVMGDGGVTTSPETSTYTEFLRSFGTRERAHLRNEHDVNGGVDVSLRPVPWVRIGGAWLSRNDTEVADIGVETVNVKPSALRGYVEVVLPSPQFRGLRVDVGGGIGLETNEMTVERALTEEANQETAYRASQSWSNIFLQGTVELFTSKHTSFFLRVMRRSPSHAIAIEGVELTVPGLPGTVSYRIDPHEVSFGGFTELMWGTRFHL